MYSSFNKFNHNVYRDANIVTGLDTFTSLLAGFTIFGILGHLAHEIGITDISNVVNGGPGLAFISYPEAIARFQFAPQVIKTNQLLSTSTVINHKLMEEKEIRSFFFTNFIKTITVYFIHFIISLSRF